MLSNVFSDGLSQAISLLVTYSAFWVVPILVIIAWSVWVGYIRRSHLALIKWTMLEVKLPQEIYKTPQAMELVLMNAFYQTGGVGTWHHRYWRGSVPVWFSLEIPSFEGNIHFFIRLPSQFRQLVESQIYAQYPDVEISETSDYTQTVPPFTKNNGWDMFGWQFKLSKSDAYPIKTYIDYGMDRNLALDEEQRIDPMTPMLEYMGSIGQGEQLWLQIIIRAAPTGPFGRYGKPDHWLQTETWQDYSKREMAEFIKKEIKATIDNGIGTAERASVNYLTEDKKEVISAMERNIQKFPFDCGLRILYIAKKENYKGTTIAGTGVLFRPFNSSYSNSLVPNPSSSAVPFDFSWQDFTGNRYLQKKINFFNAFKLRSYFYHPYQHQPFVLTTEELASIYHFPGKVSETPSFKRIDSKKSEPPTDLPI